MKTAYVALGSNLGRRLAQMRAALNYLSDDFDVRVVQVSPVYENRAIGMGNADPFLNAVAKVETVLEPEALLDGCLVVEEKLGRVRTGSWAPRTIDLDLLAYEGISMQSERLTLPHPRITERDFVAKPLMDLAPELILSGKSVRAWVRALPMIDLALYSEEILGPDF